MSGRGAPRARWYRKTDLSANESLLDLKGAYAHVGPATFRFACEGQAFEGLSTYVVALKGREKGKQRNCKAGEAGQLGKCTAPDLPVETKLSRRARTSAHLIAATPPPVSFGITSRNLKIPLKLDARWHHDWSANPTIQGRRRIGKRWG